MLTLLCSTILCTLTSFASAQTGYFKGITPRPADDYAFPASLTVTRSAPSGGAGTLVPALYTHVSPQRVQAVRSPLEALPAAPAGGSPS